MNDIQERENIYSAATAAVHKRQENITAVNANLVDAQNAYLRSVAHAATLCENLRRKRDLLFNIIIWGVLAIIAVILFFINFVAGIIYVVVVLLLAYLIISRNSEANKTNYSKRRAFFQKYAAVIPAGMQLKWDGSTLPAGRNSKTSGIGWSCPVCTAHNPSSTNFCMNCGTKKY